MPDFYADPVAVRLNKALRFMGKVGPHGFIHGWIYVGTDGSKISDLDHEKIGEHFGSDAGDAIKAAKDSAASGDHEGAIHHLDEADRAIADHIQAHRGRDESIPESNDEQGLLSMMRDHRQQQSFASQAPSGGHHLFHRS
jgi:hypothetical protein